MTDEKFKQLVIGLETFAAENPGGYKQKVLLLALLGYVYIFGVLAILGGLVWLLVKFVIFAHGAAILIYKLGIPMVVLICVALRSLWVKFEVPKGLVITAEDCPKLFTMIDEIRALTKGPRLTKVILDDDYNASVMQLPKLGIFGCFRNYLIIGLPLMMSLSEEQFRAILAHEFGHLSAAHGRFGNWVYRVRKTWYRLMEKLEKKKQAGTFIFQLFFNWYAPYFWVYTFVLTRANEYEADRYAALAGGAGEAASALVGLEIQSARLEEDFWPTLYKRSARESAPPGNLIALIREELKKPINSARSRVWLKKALARETDLLDTHPALTDRLTALGQEPQEPLLPSLTAAESLFGNYLEELSGIISSDWKEGVQSYWQARFKSAQEDKEKLKTMNANAASLSIDEHLELASMTEEYEGDAEGLKAYQKVLMAYPDNAPALYNTGRILLSMNKTEGIEYIEKAMTMDEEAIAHGCYIISDFYEQAEQEIEAKAYKERLERQLEIINRAGDEVL